MNITITMTSKGQFTLPASIRKAMALRKQGDKLVLDYSPTKKQATLSKPISFEDIQARASMYVKPGTVPLGDVGALYGTRKPRL